MAKVLELQVSISPSNEYSELISFRIEWFDRLAVQCTMDGGHYYLVHLQRLALTETPERAKGKVISLRV